MSNNPGNTPNSHHATSPELLPCPFCGGDMQPRHALWPSDGDVDAIIHTGPSCCALRVFSMDTADEGVSVAKAWNERARSSAIEEPADLVRKWQEENHEWFKRDIAEIVEDFAKWMLSRQPQSPSYAGVTDAMLSAGEQAHWELTGAMPSKLVLSQVYLAMRAADTSDGEVERVARAIWDALLPFDGTIKMQWSDAKGVARAALSAIRNGQSTSDGVQPCEVERLRDIIRQATDALQDLGFPGQADEFRAMARSQSKQVDDGGGK